MLPRTATDLDHAVYDLISRDANTPSSPTYWAAHRLSTLMEGDRTCVAAVDEYPCRGGLMRNYRMSDNSEVEARLDLEANPIIYTLVSISMPPMRNEPPEPEPLAVSGQSWGAQLDDANVVPHTDQPQTFPDPVQHHTPITPQEHMALVALIERCWADPELDLRTYVGSPGLSPWVIGGQTHVLVSPVVNEFLRALAQASFNVGQAEEERIHETRLDPLATGARKLRL